jgi:hypothetical protein
MKNQDVIESIQLVETPKLQASYPQARTKGRLITTKVVGVTFSNRDRNRQEIIARLQMGDRVWLEMEPDNRYDPNAIKVCCSNGEQIGYINRHLAASIHPYFAAYGHPVRGRVTLLTGSNWDGYTLGCVISFKLPKTSQIKHNTFNSLFDDWED